MRAQNEDLPAAPGGLKKAIQAVQRIKDRCDDRAEHLWILDECDRALGVLTDAAAGTSAGAVPQVCGACGKPWDGEPCGEWKNGWADACTPVPAHMPRAGGPEIDEVERLADTFGCDMPSPTPSCSVALRWSPTKLRWCLHLPFGEKVTTALDDTQAAIVAKALRSSTGAADAVVGDYEPSDEEIDAASKELFDHSDFALGDPRARFVGPCDFKDDARAALKAGHRARLARGRQEG